MNRNLKALGLALVAVFAMAAVFASGAQALKVTVSSSPAWLTGEAIPDLPKITNPVHHFTLAGGQTLTCEESKFAATVKNTEETITVVPTYGKCHAIIGSEKFLATVTMNDCDFVFTGGAEVSSTTFNKVEVSLVCPKEKNVEIHVYKKPATELEGELCTYTVPPFTDKKENEFHNEGSGSTNDVTLTTTVTEIPVIREGGLLCGAANTTATYTGNTTIKASEDKGGTISNGTVSGLEEGAQVSLTVSK